MNTSELPDKGLQQYQKPPEDEFAGLREEYQVLQERGWIGEQLPLEEFAKYDQLRRGLVTAEEIGFLRQAVPEGASLSFEVKLMAQDLTELGKTHGIIGNAVRPFDLVVSPNLISGLLTVLQDRGVDVSDYISPTNPELGAGQ